MNRTFTLSISDYRFNEDNYIGLCISCGADNEQCEPDARKYQCDMCGDKSVYGTPELLMMGMIDIEE